MTVSAVRRLLALAAESRGACLIQADDAKSGPGISARMTLADGQEVGILVLRENEEWAVVSPNWEGTASDCADAVLHAVSCAMGDAS